MCKQTNKEAKKYDFENILGRPENFNYFSHALSRRGSPDSKTMKNLYGRPTLWDINPSFFVHDYLWYIFTFFKFMIHEKITEI